MDSSKISASEIFCQPVKKATGNPYPKRGNIRHMIFDDISMSIQAALFSIKLPLKEDYESLGTSTGYGKKKARGNPYPRRGQIRDKIFKDVFKSVPVSG